MIRTLGRCWILPGLILCLPALAKVEIVQFEDPARQALYQEMIQELRCLVCQNQNLADSNAELAQDLRKRTRELIEEGRDRDEIADYMVARYGDFVLYRPRLNASTMFLWFSPLVLLLVVVILVLRWRRRAQTMHPGYSQQDLSRAKALMQGDIQPDPDDSAGNNRQ